MPIFVVFGLTRSGIELESTVSVADAQSTQPLIGFVFFCLERTGNQCQMQGLRQEYN